MKTITRLAAAAALVVALPLCAQCGAPAGKVERIKVHSPAIEGNLQGNTADRDVLVIITAESYVDIVRQALYEAILLALYKY